MIWNQTWWNVFTSYFWWTAAQTHQTDNSFHLCHAAITAEDWLPMKKYYHVLKVQIIWCAIASRCPIYSKSISPERNLQLSMAKSRKWPLGYHNRFDWLICPPPPKSNKRKKNNFIIRANTNRSETAFLKHLESQN